MFDNEFSFNERIRTTEYGLSFIIPLVWFLWAQGAKRCHDLGHRGWYQIIPLYFLWLIFDAGDRSDNAYGSDPKAEAELVQPASLQVACPNCGVGLDLNDAEVAEKRYQCPRCGIAAQM